MKKFSYSKIKLLGAIIFLFLCVVPLFAYAAPSWWPLVPCGFNAQPKDSNGVELPKVPTSENPYVHDYTQPCNQCDLLKLLKNIIDFILYGLMPPAAAILFVWGGFLILMGGANPGWISEGRKIFFNTAVGVAIILASWLITNTIIRSIGAETVTVNGVVKNVATDWWKFECRVTTPGPTTTVQPPFPPISTACRQNFNLSPANGCSGTTCVDVSNLTPTHGCESHDGVCLLSPEAAAAAMNFVSAFNRISGGQCTLRLSSTIQGGNGPSVSQCHQPGNSKSGTCADFNLLPDHDSCRDYFYQASQESGSIVSFLDEYVNACAPSNATGGNIHVNFSSATTTTVPTYVDLSGTGKNRIALITADVDPLNTNPVEPKFNCTKKWTASDLGSTWINEANQYVDILSRFPPINTSKLTLCRSDSLNANTCPNTLISVYVTQCTESDGYVSHAYASSRKIYLRSDADSTTLAHELGHQFGLKDEYYYDKPYPSPFFSDSKNNCKYTDSSCPNASVQNGYQTCNVSSFCPGGLGQCYGGCAQQGPETGWYRDAPSDIMFDNHIPYNQFGPVDKQVIQTYLNGLP